MVKKIYITREEFNYLVEWCKQNSFNHTTNYGRYEQPRRYKGTRHFYIGHSSLNVIYSKACNVFSEKHYLNIAKPHFYRYEFLVIDKPTKQE